MLSIHSKKSSPSAGEEGAGIDSKHTHFQIPGAATDYRTGKLTLYRTNKKNPKYTKWIHYDKKIKVKI